MVLTGLTGGIFGATWFFGMTDAVQLTVVGLLATVGLGFGSSIAAFRSVSVKRIEKTLELLLLLTSLRIRDVFCGKYVAAALPTA